MATRRLQDSNSELVEYFRKRLAEEELRAGKARTEKRRSAHLRACALLRRMIDSSRTR